MSTILVIDDRAINRELLVKLLGYRGHKVLEAKDGLEALEIARAYRPALIITDIVMPNMDGYDLAAKIRATPALADTPIIFYTATYLAEQAQVLAQAAGVKYVLPKPSEPEVILRVVDAALGLIQPSESPDVLQVVTQSLKEDATILLAKKLVEKTAKLEGSTFRLAAIIELCLALAAESNPLSLGQIFTDASRKIIGARWVAVSLIGPNRLRMESVWSSGASENISPPAAYHDLLEETIHTGKPQRLAAFTFIGDRVGPSNGPIPVLVAPILEEASAHGCACFFEKLGATEFSDEDERIALTLGAVLATTHEKARLNQEVQRRAAELQLEISVRKRAEEASVMLTQAVNTSGEVVFMTDLEGVFTFVNTEFTRLYGHTAEDVVGKATPRILKSGRTSPEEYASYWKTILDKRVVKGEWVNKTRDGRLVTMDESANPIIDERGDITGFLAIQRDTTKRKQLELQLRQSQKMEAIGQLAGGVAHDFNNLLTIISGYGELVADALGPDSPHHGHVKEIQKAAERAAGLTRQLLAFGRRQVLEPQVLDLNVVVANVDKMLRRLIGEDIELVSVSSGELGRVKADAGQIEQIIMNLAVNARDAMAEGGKLTIETANVNVDAAQNHALVTMTPGPYVMLAVSDTGSGMDKETQARIFEPFFTTKEKGKGTGLGLATVYGIVKQSGGFIWVYSELGKGTTIKIYLPRVDEIAATFETIRARPVLNQGSETILVVEDEESLRSLVQTVLGAKGYTVLLASRGQEALDICMNQPGVIHLMLTDVVMPQMSGRELAKQVAGVRPQTKVLYMSGYTDNAIVHHGVLDAGMAFIQKPFTPAALASKVREVLAA